MQRSVNPCSVYVLPLVGVNRFSFGGEDVFVNSFVSQDNKYVVVQCSQERPFVALKLKTFICSFEKDNFNYLVFEVPSVYRADVLAFREGKFSQFSPAAKDMIKKKSGLTYKAPMPGGTYRSALELLALDKDAELKKYWETLLGVTLAENAELASVPGPENFFELNISTNLPVPA
jgi:hypothetical protein